MIEVKWFFKMQKMYFLYMMMMSLAMYFFVEMKYIWFFMLLSNFTHALLAHGIGYGLCKVFAQVFNGQIPYRILFQHIGIFLIFLPIVFMIREIWDNDHLQAISTLLLLLLPNVILLCYLYLKRSKIN